jgi:hypothetical protein
VQQWVEYLVLGLSVVFIIFIITIGRRILRKGLSLDDEEAGELSSK